MHLGDEVGDGQLQLVSPQPPVLGGGRKVVARPQKQQDVGGLADEPPSRLQKWRRKRQVLAVHPLAALAASTGVEDTQHRRHSGGAARDIDVRCGRFFESESHEFTAALDPGPVVELIGHGCLVSGDG